MPSRRSFNKIRVFTTICTQQIYEFRLVLTIKKPIFAAFVQKKKFIFDLAILLILNLLIKPFWILAIEPNVQMKVGNVSYGEYFVLFNFSFLINILLDFGLTNFNNKNIAQHSHLLSKHFSKMLSLKFVLGLLYISVT